MNAPPPRKQAAEEAERVDLPPTLPVLPVRDLVVFPDMLAPLFVSRPLSVLAVERALAGPRLVLLLAQRRVDAEEPLGSDLYELGTAAILVRQRRLADGRLKLLVQGLGKARVESFSQERPCFEARVRPILDLPLSEVSLETEALVRAVHERLGEYATASGRLGPDVLEALMGFSDPGRLADLVAAHLPLPVDEAQALLETPDPIRRLRRVLEHLGRETELSSARARIERDVQERVGKNQREYYLREQLRQIRSELGEAPEDEVGALRERIDASDLPEVHRAEALKQLGRLARMSAESAEAATLRTYLEWLLELAWQRCSADRLSLPLAKGILDEDHLGLEEVKERILEFLAVRKLRPDARGPILCLVGPPGVGKTSLGRSVARALEREFVRLSLGGVRDEAEIRGHRRTYVGAMPGRIIQALKTARVANPVLALDEVDKLGHDVRGDPASALLEVLDPEQNHAFVDRYLDLPYDLSRVLFLATANRTDTIPPPLLDRMEVVVIPGYTLEEKLAIASGRLLPQERERCGLSEAHLRLSAAALERLVLEHTREAGLRELGRQLAKLCRRAARSVADDGPGLGELSPEGLAAVLGPALHRPQELTQADLTGVAHGLAWTPAGGEVLTIEATSMPGRGQLILTGQLGDVMKESAQIALSLVRTLGPALALAEDVLAHRDLHIHVPAGAIPKDGPSAGLAMAVALVSLAAGRPVHRQIGLTGEITLRGRVLPIGGLREKLLAAARAGLRRVIVPAANQAEVDSVRARHALDLEVLSAGNLEQALAWALHPAGSSREEA
jgi:ATP-dependent Lon protease